MKRDVKKVAAAGLAVLRYLEAEQKQRGEEAPTELSGTADALAPAASASGSLWAASGRLSAMQIRNFMQYRVFHRI
jgi:hypothetical protein